MGVELQPTGRFPLVAAFSVDAADETAALKKPFGKTAQLLEDMFIQADGDLQLTVGITGNDGTIQHFIIGKNKDGKIAVFKVTSGKGNVELAADDPLRCPVKLLQAAFHSDKAINKFFNAVIGGNFGLHTRIFDLSLAMKASSGKWGEKVYTDADTLWGELVKEHGSDTILSDGRFSLVSLEPAVALPAAVEETVAPAQMAASLVAEMIRASAGKMQFQVKDGSGVCLIVLEKGNIVVYRKVANEAPYILMETAGVANFKTLLSKAYETKLPHLIAILKILKEKSFVGEVRIDLDVLMAAMAPVDAKAADVGAQNIFGLKGDYAVHYLDAFIKVTKDEPAPPAEASIATTPERAFKMALATAKIDIQKTGSRLESLLQVAQDHKAYLKSAPADAQNYARAVQAEILSRTGGENAKIIEQIKDIKDFQNLATFWANLTAEKQAVPELRSANAAQAKVLGYVIGADGSPTRVEAARDHRVDVPSAVEKIPVTFTCANAAAVETLYDLPIQRSEVFRKAMANGANLTTFQATGKIKLTIANPTTGRAFEYEFDLSKGNISLEDWKALGMGTEEGFKYFALGGDVRMIDSGKIKGAGNTISVAAFKAALEKRKMVGFDQKQRIDYIADAEQFTILYNTDTVTHYTRAYGKAEGGKMVIDLGAFRDRVGVLRGELVDAVLQRAGINLAKPGTVDYETFASIIYTLSTLSTMKPEQIEKYGYPKAGDRAETTSALGKGGFYEWLLLPGEYTKLAGEAKKVEDAKSESTDKADNGQDKLLTDAYSASIDKDYKKAFSLITDALKKGKLAGRAKGTYEEIMKKFLQENRIDNEDKAPDVELLTSAYALAKDVAAKDESDDDLQQLALAAAEAIPLDGQREFMLAVKKAGMDIAKFREANGTELQALEASIAKESDPARLLFIYTALIESESTQLNWSAVQKHALALIELYPRLPKTLQKQVRQIFAGRDDKGKHVPGEIESLCLSRSIEQIKVAYEIVKALQAKGILKDMELVVSTFELGKKGEPTGDMNTITVTDAEQLNVDLPKVKKDLSAYNPLPHAALTQYIEYYFVPAKGAPKIKDMDKTKRLHAFAQLTYILDKAGPKDYKLMVQWAQRNAKSFKKLKYSSKLIPTKEHLKDRESVMKYLDQLVNFHP